MPLILDALAVSGAEFRVLASPWTAPPWMKDNSDWNGGSLKPEHQATFAAYLVRYIKAKRDEANVETPAVETSEMRKTTLVKPTLVAPKSTSEPASAKVVNVVDEGDDAGK